MIDDKGNVISKFGEIVVAKHLLDPATDDIPPELFRELFVPLQVSRNLGQGKRPTTGVQRVSAQGLVQKFNSSSSSGMMRSRDTLRVSNK